MTIEEVFILRRVKENEIIKNPMTNAIYIALITAIYAIIFIVSSEFVFKYDHFLSDSRWSLFIQNKNMKYVGLGMIGVAIIIDTFSALRRKKFDEYQIITLEKIMLFNGSFLNIIFPLSLFILIFVPAYFVETIFFLHSISMAMYDHYRNNLFDQEL